MTNNLQLYVHLKEILQYNRSESTSTLCQISFEQKIVSQIWRHTSVANHWTQLTINKSEKVMFSKIVRSRRSRCLLLQLPPTTHTTHTLHTPSHTHVQAIATLLSSYSLYSVRFVTYIIWYMEVGTLVYQWFSCRQTAVSCCHRKSSAPSLYNQINQMLPPMHKPPHTALHTDGGAGDTC